MANAKLNMLFFDSAYSELKEILKSENDNKDAKKGALLAKSFIDKFCE